METKLPTKNRPVRGFFGILGTMFGSAWRLHRREMLIVIFCAIASGAFQSYAPQLLQRIIDGFSSGSFAAAGGTGAFQTLLAFFVLTGVAGLLFKVFAEKTAFYLATRTEDYWRYTVLQKYYELPVSWHDQQDSGEVASRIDRGGSAIFSVIYELFGQVFFVDFVTLLFVLPLAYLANPSFFWVLFLPIPVLTTATYLISRRISEGQNRINELDKQSQKALYDGAMNIRTVKAFGKELEETRRYEKAWNALHTYEYALQRLYFLQTFIFTILDIGVRGLILFVSFGILQSAQASIGQIVLLLSYQQLVFQPLVRLNQIFTRISRQVNRAKILISVVEDSDRANARMRPIELGPLKKKLVFRNVSFSYGRGVEAVKRASFTIPHGSTVALVGRSGAGKTTVAALIAGFYSPTSGTILWDGQNIDHASQNSIAKQVSYVAQDSTLFNRSIRSNIAYADEHASDHEVREAAEYAHVHGFVTAMRKGYESVIGERGVRLSGGQRQRVALARALLAKGSLLILDESTSQLDTESERAIQGAIEKLQGRITQVIIAHRLSTVLHADQILVLDKGRIVASGRHEDLLRKSPIYKKLYDLQFQD